MKLIIRRLLNTSKQYGKCIMTLHSIKIDNVDDFFEKFYKELDKYNHEKELFKAEIKHYKNNK